MLTIKQLEFTSQQTSEVAASGLSCVVPRRLHKHGIHPGVMTKELTRQGYAQGNETDLTNTPTSNQTTKPNPSLDNKAPSFLMSNCKTKVPLSCQGNTQKGHSDLSESRVEIGRPGEPTYLRTKGRIGRRRLDGCNR